MKSNMKFSMLIIIFLFSLTFVSAEELNSTDFEEVVAADEANTTLKIEDEVDTNSSAEEDVAENNTTGIKDTPKVTIKSNNVKSQDTVVIYLKNSTGNPLKSKNLIVSINNKNSIVKTDSKGAASYKIDLPAGSYNLKITYNGDENYTSISKNFKIKVSKLDTKILKYSNFVIKKKYLYVFLYDSNFNSVANKKLTIKVNGKKYTKKTKSNGRAGIKIKLSKSKYKMKVKFKGDSKFKSSSKTFKFYIVKSLSLKTNSKLLTKGYLRVYLKDSSISKKRIKITIGSKTFKKKTNSEGIVIIKPNVKAKTYKLTVKYKKYYISKKIRCYEGSVKDPLVSKCTYNGKPDVDVMPSKYVLGRGNAKYTLKKSQYKEVLKRDSKCLFLFNKLTKYTFFKTKNHPNTYHILKRSKWNVIERAILTKIVKKNKKNYWPGKITVKLKGKAYTYPEVRDVQNTGYTCGPASASMCSQVLKNYLSEKYIAKHAGTTKSSGTKIGGLEYVLEKNNYNCTHFYKNSFSYALNQLKIGGCALIFHSSGHYVSILDISKDGKKVLVSNSYGSYNKIPTKWVKVSYMKKKFGYWDDSLIVRLNYKLSKSKISSLNAYYSSMGSGWTAHNTHASIGKI